MMTSSLNSRMLSTISPFFWYWYVFLTAYVNCKDSDIRVTVWSNFILRKSKH
jgi:hypothetical protein